MIDTDRMPLALGPEEGEALWCVGALTTVKASAEQTAGAYAIVEDLAPRGSGTPLHRHPDDDEAFYVLAGEMTFVLGEETVHGTPGSFIHIPGGTVHAFRVDSDTARYLIITTPQHERFYRAIAEPAQRRSLPPDMPPDMEKIGAACAAFRVEGVGATLEVGI